MNKNIILLALAGTLLLGAAVYLATQKTSVSNSKIDEDVIQKWKQFKRTYNKKYADVDEEAYRIQVFAYNLEVVKNDTTGTYGITQFFDLTPQEFQTIYLTLEVENDVEPEESEEEEEVNADINWVTKGKVTRVKNQGQCGSCWAFSTTGALESALILKGSAGQNIDLSEQQLIDCSKENSGCNGGLMNKAFDYIKDNKITTESNYSYKAIGQTCNNDNIKEPLYTLKSYKKVSGGINGLKAALQKQPIAIAVNASNWSYYTGGVFAKCQSTGLNHGVLLVGYEDGVWIVKNSWSEKWGENGFIRLADGNTCGLANQPSFPQV